jgi:hypothetical protein
VIQRIMAVLVMSLCFQGLSLAAEQVTVQERVVGGTFKTMAKAYIATADIRQLKEKNIKRVENMREDWFKKKYAEVYKVIKDLPPKLRTKYGVKENMTKAQVIAVIRSLDKKQIYEIIDQVPDPMISQQFNAQFSQKDGEAKDGLTDRIGKIWAKVVAEVNAPSKQ